MTSSRGKFAEYGEGLHNTIVIALDPMHFSFFTIAGNVWCGISNFSTPFSTPATSVPEKAESPVAHGECWIALRACPASGPFSVAGYDEGQRAM
jgi:hypothetical protein